MKKATLILSVAGLAFASCKKDYKCTCTYNGTSQKGSVSTTLHDTKSGAKTTCDSYNDSDPAIAGVCVIE
jgi:hypothetical protein